MKHYNHGKAKGVAHPEWYKVGSNLGELANKISKRSDLVVLASPEAALGEIACFNPDISEIEINTDRVFGGGIDPSMIGDLTESSVQYEFPQLVGALTHEAFHARFSAWNLVEAHNALDQDEVRALIHLEESRIEKWGIEDNYLHRAFLRSCAMELVLDEFSAEQEKNSLDALSLLVAIVHGRVIAGVLDIEEVDEIVSKVNDELGLDVIQKLTRILKEFQAHDNHKDLTAVYPLAKEWAQIFRDLAKERGEEKNSESMEKLMISIMEKLEEVGEEISISTYSELADQEQSEEWKSEVKTRADKTKEREDNKKVAQEIFKKGIGPSPDSSTRSYLTESRKPTSSERTAAVTVAQLLEKAKYRERDITEVASVLPPGRLRTKSLVQARALKERGVMDTVEPWRRTVRRHTDDPNLTVGVMVDISGSMSSAMQPMATTAWVMSEATRRVQGRMAMVYFGDDVFPTLKAGQHLSNVSVYTASDGTEKFDRAFKALDGELNLLNATGARLLVVVSDCHYKEREIEAVRKWISRCDEVGVAVLWLPFSSGNEANRILKNTGAEVLCGELDPVTAAGEIGKASAKVLTQVGKRNT